MQLRASLLVCSVALFGAPASATLVTSRPALGGTDFINWDQFGPPYTAVANGSSGATDLGSGFTVSNPNGDLARLDQGLGWQGNFPGGSRLIATNSTAGSIVIDLAAPVFGAGAEIQANAWGSFVGRIAVYDTSNNLLEQHTLNGISDTNVGTAIFIGIDRAVADIDRIEFDLSPNGDLAINRLDLRAVPEPGTAALLCVGLLSLRIRRPGSVE